MSVFLFI